MAKVGGVSMTKVADAALHSVGVTNTAATALKKTVMLRNVMIAEQDGVLRLAVAIANVFHAAKKP